MIRWSFIGLVFVFSVFLCAIGSNSGAADTSSASVNKEIDAYNIGIKSQYKITVADEAVEVGHTGGEIRYSPDGRFLLYVYVKKAENPEFQAVIVDVTTRKIQKTFKVHDTDGFAWSPDGTRIVHFYGGFMAIHNIKSGKNIDDVELRLQNGVSSELTWFKDDKIYINYDNVLDLNTLSVIKISEEEALLVKKLRDRCLDAVCFAGGQILAPRTDYFDRNYFNYYDDSGDHIRKSKYHNDQKAIPSVVVSNKDGSFTKVLVEAERHFAYDISPKLNSFAYVRGDGLYLAYLDTNFKTERNYLIENFQPLLNDDLKSAYNSFLSRNVPIVGEIYDPKINPLTGKVIGPGGKYKGSVKIADTGNGNVVVQKIFERTAFKADSDVVSNFIAISDKNGMKDFFEFKNIWRTLHTISEKKLAVAKEDKEKQVENALVVAKDRMWKADADGEPLERIHRTNLKFIDLKGNELTEADLEAAFNPRSPLKEDVLVLDKSTKLMWIWVSPKLFDVENESFIGARKFVMKLNAIKYAGYSDWRLPSKEELNKAMQSPPEGMGCGTLLCEAANLTRYENWYYLKIWSSTKSPSSLISFWQVKMGNGGNTEWSIDIDEEAAVWPVRDAR